MENNAAQKRYRSKKHEIKVNIPKEYQEPVKVAIQNQGLSYQKVFELGLRSVGCHYEQLTPVIDKNQLTIF